LFGKIQNKTPSTQLKNGEHRVWGGEWMGGEDGATGWSGDGAIGRRGDGEKGDCSSAL